MSNTIEKTDPQNSEDSLLEVLCRICFTSDNKKYVHPCKCKGTIGLVHAECLEQWLVETGRNTCELCGSVYVTERELRYTAEQSLYIWFLTRHKYSFVHLNYVRVLRTDVLISLILTVIVLIGNFFCIHGADVYITALKNDWPSTNKWTSLALFLILGLLISGYYAWMIVAVKYHFHKWYWWWQHSLTVKLIADAIDIEAYRQNLRRDVLHGRNDTKDKKEHNNQEKNKNSVENVQKESNLNQSTQTRNS